MEMLIFGICRIAQSTCYKYLASRNLVVWLGNTATENLIKLKRSYYKKTIFACIYSLALV